LIYNYIHKYHISISICKFTTFPRQKQIFVYFFIFNALQKKQERQKKILLRPKIIKINIIYHTQKADLIIITKPYKPTYYIKYLLFSKKKAIFAKIFTGM